MWYNVRKGQNQVPEKAAPCGHGQLIIRGFDGRKRKRMLSILKNNVFQVSARNLLKYNIMIQQITLCLPINYVCNL